MGKSGAAHLGDEQLARGQLPLAGIHLPVGIHLRALKLFAAVHQGLDLRLHLADIQTGHGELLFDDSIHICQLNTGGNELNHCLQYPEVHGAPETCPWILKMSEGSWLRIPNDRTAS